MRRPIRNHRSASKLVFMAVLSVSRCPCQEARADLLFESATLGPATNSVLFQPSLQAQHLGVRFSLLRASRIEQIGGHFIGHDQGRVVGAIVPLEPDGFPIDAVGNAWPDLEAVALASALIELPSDESAEVLQPVNVVLEKGTYGLVFGANLFERRGIPGGAMVDSGEDIGNPEYFFWESSDNIWRNISARSGMRFVVYGEPIPEPPITAIIIATVWSLLFGRVSWRRLVLNRWNGPLAIR